MSLPSWTECSAPFLANPSAYPQYAYTGAVRSPLVSNSSTQVTYDGCVHFCGHEPRYYSWNEISRTLTTWTLPVIGVILQAPFESNAFWSTVFLLARWIGNPIASITYTLWNIKITGRAALLVDLSVRCDEERESLGPRTDFGRMRDSLFILVSMNQFAVNAKIAKRREAAETLLRIALFSKGLHRPQRIARRNDNDGSFMLVRENLALNLRRFRRRGIVPVCVSTMWFLFALAISVQSAFALSGANATAHDLALGLLLAWLPVLFLAFIVDRNFTNADEVRTQLNNLVEDVGQALADKETRATYVRTYNRQSPDIEERLTKVQDLIDSLNGEDFFVAYAGQGRLRWHYGVAHAIITDIEYNYIRHEGRAWLTFDEAKARSILVLGDTNSRGLFTFDVREAFQMFSAAVIVLGSITGAFCLAYLEPVVGLGCRSGGYTIFAVLALANLLGELVAWAVMMKYARKGSLAESLLRDRYVNVMLKVTNNIDWLFTQVSCAIPFQMRGEENISIRNLAERQKNRRQWGVRIWIDWVPFRLTELLSGVFLTYIIFAQTFGSYNKCSCLASTWGPEGGYVDLKYLSNSSVPMTGPVVAFGISLAIVLIAMIYIVLEWCLQSHLSTLDHNAALRGLHRTRQFRRITFPYRWLYDRIIRLALYGGHDRTSVFWTFESSRCSSHNAKSSLSSSSRLPFLTNVASFDPLTMDPAASV